MIDFEPYLVHLTDKQKYTPLHWAARRGYRKLARMLISKGANIEAKDIKGKTPKEVAENVNCWKVANLLDIEMRLLKKLSSTK